MSPGQNQSSSNTRNKIGGGNSSNKMNSDKPLKNPPGQVEADPNSNSNPDPNQCQEQNVKEASITDLPTEMLMEIFQYLDTRSLLALRLVNCHWSSISSPILCHRPDAQVCFEFMNTNNFLRCESELCRLGEKELVDFLGCMKKCKNVPYAHFSFSLSFYAEPTELFDDPNFQEFLSYFSSSKSSQNPDSNQHQRIKALELKFREMKDVNTFEIVAGKLGDLLLDKNPFVENLSLEFEDSRSGNAAGAKLFPTSNQNKKHAEINPVEVEAEPEPEPEFQLAHLKVVRFRGGTILNYSGILRDLLSAAVNLEKVYLYETKIRPHVPIALEHFDLLQPLGKFHVLKNIVCDLNDKCLSRVKARPDFTRALFNLELEELELSTSPENLSTCEYVHA